jgi:hypothetical protein
VICFFLQPPAGLPSPEIALAPALLAAALAAAYFAPRWLGCWEGPLARLARRKWLAILLAALSPLVLRALLLPWFPAPQPRFHDEFSFLLGADTLLHGRLANPQSPFWPHFESMHILVQPTYASAFPLAQAAALASGRLLFGHPWAGVWLGVALMGGALCWMLQGWLPPRWALLGALLAVLRLGVSSYWMNTYWGGALAAAGGALVLGALPRIVREPRWRHSLAMGLGLALLANSRPFEGAVFGLVIGVLLLLRMLGKNGPPLAVALRRIVLPLALSLALVGAGMVYYFARVTGNPLLPPYVLYRNTMTMAPHFLWQAPRPQPLFSNREMRHFYLGWEMSHYLKARQAPLRDLWDKLGLYWRFYLGPLLTVPLLLLPCLWRDRKARPLLLATAAFSLALWGQVWHNPHYAAPAAGLAFLIILMALRRLRLWRWRSRPVGLCLVRALPAACALLLLVQVLAGPSAATDGQPNWRWAALGGQKRARILAQLERSPEKHLVLVRYAPRRDPGDEWVYNGADLDGARVVWARELDRSSNASLMRHFADRRVWLLEPDQVSPRLIPYQDAPPRLMPFVQLGAPGIPTLRSPEDVRRKVLDKSEGGPLAPHSCDVWNYYFSESTGVAGPDAIEGCPAGHDRAQPVTFDHWFCWLRSQR